MRFLSLFSVLISLVCFQALAAPTDVCNGQSALCGKKYSNVTFIGTHDSAFVGPLPTQNQDKSVTDQLNSGVRFLQSQTHSFLGTLRMCHTSCLAEDAGTIQKYLQQVKDWLDKNPRDLVTLLWTNPDKIPMNKLDAIFKKVGADKYVFKPATSPDPLPADQWPLLGDMINANNRLVVFIDYGADEKSVPYLLDEFNYFFETEFNTVDPSFNFCNIDRKNKVDSDGQSSMYIVNHFLDVQIPETDIKIPDRMSASRTNAADGFGSVGGQADLCAGSHGRNPNVILLDFFGKGDPMPVQNRMNGI